PSRSASLFPTRRSSDLATDQILLTGADLGGKTVEAYEEQLAINFSQFPADEVKGLVRKYGQMANDILAKADTEQGAMAIILAEADRKSTRLNSSHVKIS